MGFKERGTVVRSYVNNAGTFGSLTLDVPNDRGSQKIDFVTFDHAGDFGRFAPGSEVTVEGDLRMRPLTAKNKSEVKVDGYSVWVPQLVITAIVDYGVACKRPLGSPGTGARTASAGFAPTKAPAPVGANTPPEGDADGSDGIPF